MQYEVLPQEIRYACAHEQSDKNSRAQRPCTLVWGADVADVAVADGVRQVVVAQVGGHRLREQSRLQAVLRLVRLIHEGANLYMNTVRLR